VRITIVGAGKVGYSVAQYLSQENHEVIVVEADEAQRSAIQEGLDVMTIGGNGGSPSVLSHPEIMTSDLFIATTHNDEVNMIACAAAKKVGIPLTIASIRNDEYIETGETPFHKTMGIDLAINTSLVTAQKISRILSIPSAIGAEDFAGGKIRLLEMRLRPESSFIDVPLKGLALPPNVLAVGILRQGKVIIPHGEDRLLAYDNVFFIGPPDSLGALSERRPEEEARVENVMIIGAGRTGRYLAVILEKKGMMVKVIDRQEDRCRLLANQLKRGIVFCGEGTDVDLLAQEGVGEADAVICLTRDDELNLLLALLAKDLGTQRTFVRVNHPGYFSLMEKVGVDVVLSPNLTTAEAILGQVHRDKFTMLALLEGAKARALEIEVPEKSKVTGKKLKEIKFPANCLVGAILRDDHVIVPNGNSVLEKDDRAVMFCLPDLVSKIEKYL